MNGYGKTDVGRKRLVNQDTFSAVKYENDCFVAVVCDGMGGAAGGGIASSIAKDIFLTELEKLLDSYFAFPESQGAPQVILPRLLRNAVLACNSFTYDLAVRDHSLHGMGTTLVAALIYEDTLYACNVGDSRLYGFTASGVVRQITKDHSYVQALVDSGRISADDARTSSRKNIITRAIGIEATVEPDIFVVGKDESMRYYLLCSDGLSNLLDEKDLTRIVLQPTELLSLEKKVECLVELANERGGNDNITAYLLDTKG
ncbi:MAG: serine/threonine-protein phosphatase [Clostridia bacterium]|nr:serine/threonine-protein phosphatase [Clostridia bacterium]